MTVEEAKGTETKPERMEAILEDAYILINEKKKIQLPPAAAWRCCAARRRSTTSSSRATRGGVTIVKRALEEPIRQIVVNAGVEGAAAYGFNAATEEYVDMIEAGIIDPTKVARTALQNAASIAGLMITTECVIADKPEDDKKMGGGMPGGMGGGDMYQDRHGTISNLPLRSLSAAGQHGRSITYKRGGFPERGGLPLSLKAPYHILLS